MISGRSLRLSAALAFAALINLGCSVSEQLQGYLGSNDLRPIVSVTGSPITEGSSGSVVVSLSKSLTEPVVIQYVSASGLATDGADYTNLNDSLTFAAGELSKTISVSSLPDVIYEGNENFNLSFTVPPTVSMSVTSAAVVIAEDDPKPTIAFTAATDTVDETVMAGVHSLGVELSGLTQYDVIVSYGVVAGGTATGFGSDYTLTAGTVTVSGGSLSNSFNILIANDSVYEGSENVIVQLSSPNAYASLGANDDLDLTITDNEGMPTVQFSAATSNAAENVTPHLIAVTLSGAAQAVTTVNYTVTGGTATGSGTDYTFTDGVLTFASLAVSRTLSMAIVDDVISDPGETIEITLSSPSGLTLGATTVHTHTIDDDEPSGTLAIYRSVGPLNTSALALGAGNNLTIGSSVATFSVALPNNIGVGDAIQYDSDNNGSVDAVIFIHGRQSSTQYDVRTAAGTIVSDMLVADNDWSIYRAYTGIANAESGVENAGLDDAIENFDTWSGGKDLVAANQQWNVALYADADDVITSVVEINGPGTGGWTSSPSNYLRFFTPINTNEVGESQRQITATPLKAYKITNATTAELLGISANYVRIEGLILDSNVATAPATLIQVGGPSSLTGAGEIHIQSNVIYSSANDSWDYITAIGDTGLTSSVVVKVWNNVITAPDYFLYSLRRTTAAVWYAYANSLVNYVNGALTNDGPDTNFTAKNNAMDGWWNSNRCYYGASGFDPASGNNICETSETTVFSRDTHSCDDASFVWSNIYDLRPQNSYCWIAQGMSLASDPNIAITTDIEGVSRPAVWDAGAVNHFSKQEVRSVGVGETAAVYSNGSIYANFCGAKIRFTTAAGCSAGAASMTTASIFDGDIIYFDSDNNGSKDKVAFLAGKTNTSSAQFYYRMFNEQSLGGIATTNWEVYRAYTSLSAAQSGAENSGIPVAVRDFDAWTGGLDQVASKIAYTFILTPGLGSDPSPVSFSGWNTSVNMPLTIHAKYYNTSGVLDVKHNGSWSTSRYRLVVSGGPAMTFNNVDFSLRGLQVEVQNPSANAGPVLITSAKAAGAAELSLNIFRGSGTYSGNNYGVRFDSTNDSASELRLYENFVYDIDPGGTITSHCVDVQKGVSKIYHNTIVNCGGSGLRVSGGSNSFAKNNLTQNTGGLAFDASGGSFDVSSGGNLSEDASSTGALSDTANRTIAFINEAGKDFTPNNVYPIRGLGIALTGDPEIAFSKFYTILNTDVFKKTYNNEIRDPGAILGQFPIIYRSVAVGASSPLATGTGNDLTIVGDTVTFSSALPDNVGVGDAIEYDSDGNGSIDSIMFIYGRTNSTEYLVKNKFGREPVPVIGDQDWNIFRAYTSLATWNENDAINDAVEDFDLESASQIYAHINYALYGGTGPDSVSGISLSVNERNLRIYTPYLPSEVGVSQRHNGRWDASKYSAVQSSPSTVYLFIISGVSGSTVGSVVVDGIQIEIPTMTGSSYQALYVGYVADATISNTIIRKTGTPNAAYHYAMRLNNPISKVFNNLIYGFPTSTNAGMLSSMIHNDYGGTLFAYNNTLVGGYKGLTDYDGVTYAKNNIVQGVSNRAYQSANAGVFHASSTSNISSNGYLPPGTNNLGDVTVQFVDAANRDYRLAPGDTVAKGTGADLSADLNLAFNLDAARNARVAPWDRGSLNYAKDILNVGSATLSDITDTRFDISIAFSGDENNNATGTLWYCNDTQNAGCDPESGPGQSSVALSRGAGIYTADNVTPVGANPSDSIKYRAVFVDVDGLSGSPLNGTAELYPLINISSANISEGMSVQLVVSLSPAAYASGNVVFDWTTSAATATAGSDYSTVSGAAVTIPAGQGSVTLPAVQTLDDSTTEASEYLNVTLSGLVNAVSGTVTGVVNIADNEIAPSISIADLYITEGQPAAPVVTLSKVSTGDVIFSYSTSNGTAEDQNTFNDFTSATGTVTIPAGQTAVTLSNIVTNDDVTVETSEYFSVTLSGLINVNGVGSDYVGVMTLLDNDAPIVNDITVSNLSLNDVTSSSFKVQIEFTGDSNSNSAVTLWYCNDTHSSGCVPTSGTSVPMVRGSGIFTAATGALPYPHFAGDEFNISVVVSDGDGVTGAPLNASVQLLPVLDVEEQSQMEGESFSFVVNMNRPSSQDVTLSWSTSSDTATAGTGNDYLGGSGSVTIVSGQTTVTLPALTTNDDGLGEPTEVFNVSISNAQGATIRTVTSPGRIMDNDPGIGWTKGFDNSADGIVVQTDQKIIVVGSMERWDNTMNSYAVRLKPNGAEDFSFNMGTGFDGYVTGLIEQPDGKIIAVGSFTKFNGVSKNYILRLLSDGTLDTTFAAGAGANSSITSAVLRADGKLIIGGYFSLYDGVARNGIAQLNSNGTLDLSFNPGSGLDNAPNKMVLTKDRKILMGGYFSVYDGSSREHIARVNINGTLDTSFNPGAGFDSIVKDVAIQSDGKIVAVGYFYTYDNISRNYITRINEDGTLDTTFDPGAGANGVISAVLIRSDGKSIIGGHFSNYNGVARGGIAVVNTDGSNDSSFNPGAGVTNGIYSMWARPSGEVVIVGGFRSYDGTSRFNAAQILVNGSLDFSFDPGTGTCFGADNVIVTSDGRVMIYGGLRTFNSVPIGRVARLNSDNSLDTTFNVGDGANNKVVSIDIQNDGKLVLGGFFTSFAGVSRNRIARINTDGSLDTTFDPGLGLNDWVLDLRVQTDGKVVLVGPFTTANGVTKNRIARLNADGSIDTTFNIGSGLNNWGKSLTLNSDGKILIGGDFTNVSGSARNRIARLNLDGTLDTTFSIGSGVNGTVETISLQDDGKILLGGAFGLINGQTRTRIARLNGDGSLDTSFNPGTGASSYVYKVLQQADGKLIVGGTFTAINGVSQKYLARLSSGGAVDTAFNISLDDAVYNVAFLNDGRMPFIGGFRFKDSQPVWYYAHSVPPNAISVGSISASDITQTSFKATVGYHGDYDEDATFTLKWCNQTDDAGCTPANDTPMTWVSGQTKFEATIGGLANPNDPGDTLKLEITIADPDGVEGSPLNGTVTLAP